MFKKLILAFVFAVTSASSFAQIPVTVTSDVPGTLQHIETMAQWASQIAQLKRDYDLAKQQFDSLNGLRNINQLLSDRMLYQALPPDLQVAYRAIKNGTNNTASDISGSLNEIARINRARECAAVNSSTAAQTVCNNKWTDMSMQNYVGQQGYDNAAKNIQDLQKFAYTLGASPDAKSVQDLQARIAIEQVKVQNEQAKLSSIAQIQQAQENMRKQNQTDNTVKMLAPGGQIRF